MSYFSVQSQEDIINTKSNNGFDFNNSNIKFDIKKGKQNAAPTIYIIEPIDAVILSKSNSINNLNKLLSVLESDENKDWAAHLILSAYFKQDKSKLNLFNIDLLNWRKEKKFNDIIMWKELISLEQSRNNLEKEVVDYSRDRAFVEIFGVTNTFFSLNYERALLSTRNNMAELALRTGFGYSYFKNYNSHLYGVPVEIIGIVGYGIFRLDAGIGYVQHYRSKATEQQGGYIFNGEGGYFYHYSVRIGVRIIPTIKEGKSIFLRLSVGDNLTPEKLVRNYQGVESNSSKLKKNALADVTFGFYF